MAASVRSVVRTPDSESHSATVIQLLTIYSLDKSDLQTSSALLPGSCP